ncbi:MAG: hypothetical protein WC741_03585 [Patescibacteria group bacterium]|jgi:hypothetical protein
MLKFKSRKGTSATLLTLGLVLVGSLVVFGLSFLTNNNKIASNPRAQSCTAADIPNSTKACCFCQNGSVRVYATANARVSNCMGTECSTAAYGTAYNATSWGYCNDSGGSYEGTCTGGPIGSSGPGGVEACPTKDSNCNKIGPYNDNPLSIDDKGLYHDGKECKGAGMKYNAARSFCAGLNNESCDQTTCQEPNINWSTEPIWVNAKGYYIVDSNCNSQALKVSSTELINYCKVDNGGGGVTTGGGGGQKVTVGADTYYGCGYAIDVSSENTVDKICSTCGTPFCVSNVPKTQVYCCSTK